jgi:hypothetical protein
VATDADENRRDGTKIECMAKGDMMSDVIGRHDLFHEIRVILTWVGGDTKGDERSVKWSGWKSGKKNQRAS